MFNWIIHCESIDNSFILLRWHLQTYYCSNYFLFRCNYREVNGINTAFMIQSDLPGMFACMYVIGQCSILQDDVSFFLSDNPTLFGRSPLALAPCCAVELAPFKWKRGLNSIWTHPNPQTALVGLLSGQEISLWLFLASCRSDSVYLSLWSWIRKGNHAHWTYPWKIKVNKKRCHQLRYL